MMLKKVLRKILWLIIAISLLSFSSCNKTSRDVNQTIDFDLAKIKERGKLVALTGYNAYSYFVYRGKPMGFEYDLVKKLADHLGVGLEIKVVREIDKMFEMLNNGEGDIIAFNLTVTKERAQQVAFTRHHNTTRQVLVQRRPQNWRDIKMHQIERRIIRNPIELEGKTVYLRNGSAYVNRMKNLSEEIGGDINLIEAPVDVTIEDLIRMVADGQIDYTISDDNIARLNQAFFANLDIATYVSFPQRIAWAVRKNAPELLDSINVWIDQMRKTPDYYVIYNKYYQNREAYKNRIKSDYFLSVGGKISQFDDLIKKYATELNWDWRMLASLIYQESRFNTDVSSWAGARGLMQVMPQTASMYGVEDLEDPVQSLKAGVSYLDYLDKFWLNMVPDSSERVKFVMASYNIGPGHIIDARNLAEKYGADPLVWSDNVEKYLLKKSNEKFYNDKIVKSGFAKGTETVRYVKEVLARYNHYKHFVS